MTCFEMGLFYVYIIINTCTYLHIEKTVYKPDFSLISLFKIKAAPASVTAPTGA